MKEKAKELVDRFYKIEPEQPMYLGVSKNQAKQCALICVDEIINAVQHRTYSEGALNKMYWEQVKQVEFRDGCFFVGHLVLALSVEHREVIGNIHENPELLTR